ncbi:MAG: L,D-transpeptidase family protein, partial [Propionibacteriaceae bacterium]|nr:L,D-transpeptidase family protein [Propionibacteriaceae bacterium]
PTPTPTPTPSAAPPVTQQQLEPAPAEAPAPRAQNEEVLPAQEADPATPQAYSSPIQAVYDTHRDALGEAESGEFPGQRNTTVVRFSNGLIILNKDTNQAFAVYGAIVRAYGTVGWEGGALGRPTSNEGPGATGGSRVSRFENGVIIWSPSTGAQAVYGAILQRYRAMGSEGGALGLPTSSEFTGGRGSRVVTFQRGLIIWTPSTGAHPVYGAILSTYRVFNYEHGALGVPITAEFSGARGARVQNFSGGQIIWSAGTGAHAVYGAIGQAYGTMGWEGGALGLPTSSEFTGRNGARVNRFQNGLIIWTPRTGAFAVRGSILEEYARQGYEGGSLGAPMSNEISVTGGWTQDFEKGRIALINGRFSIIRPGPAVDARCRTGRVLCISKSDRKMRWMINGQVIREFDARFGSTRTPTREGQFTVFRKVRNEWSYIYNVPMPFSMYFSGGQAVHYSADFANRGYNGASGGCVNIRDYAGIQWLYDTQVRVGDKVVVYW